MTSLAEDAVEIAASMPPPARKMTLAEFMALPDDGVDRWLIRGELREGEMSRRGFRHSTYNADIVIALGMWLRARPDLGGRIATGDVGFRLSPDSETTVGIDVAYLSRELAARTDIDAFLIEGPPILAVEILSPSDRFGDVFEKIESYVEAGVRLVWLVEPIFKTVVVYRPDARPKLFNLDDELTAEPHLPGFRARVAELFGG